MLNLTPVIARAKLDTLRKLFHGEAATLCLLDHARPNRRGYDVLIDVLGGWHLHSGKDIGEALVLEIAETETVTRALLDKAVAFGIYVPSISDPAKVWAIVEDGRKAPTYPAKRIWVFVVSSTDEPLER
jgi:hypothetical protein